MHLEKFKNDILFEAIHQEERYSTIDKYLETARKIYQFRKGELYDGDTSFSVYCSIAFRIIYLKGLIAVCNDLQKKGYELQVLVLVDDNYYQNFFKEDIKRGNEALRKLRPYVLEYCKGMKPDGINDLKNNEKLGKFFGKWFKYENN